MSSAPLPKDRVSPREVFAEVARTVPVECRGNVVVIGSLAAGYQLLAATLRTGLRAKDVSRSST